MKEDPQKCEYKVTKGFESDEVLQNSQNEVSVLLTEIQHYLKHQYVDHSILQLKECQKCHYLL